MQLIFAVIVIWAAFRSLRKSADTSEFSTAFYVKKKRYGINVMDDRPTIILSSCGEYNVYSE